MSLLELKKITVFTFTSFDFFFNWTKKQFRFKVVIDHVICDTAHTEKYIDKHDPKSSPSQFSVLPWANREFQLPRFQGQ